MKNGFLTNAGRLLFSKNKPLVLKTAIFATDQKVTFIDIQRYEGNIFDLVQKAMKYINQKSGFGPAILQMVSSGAR